MFQRSISQNHSKDWKLFGSTAIDFKKCSLFCVGSLLNVSILLYVFSFVGNLGNFKQNSFPEKYRIIDSLGWGHSDTMFYLENYEVFHQKASCVA